MVAAFGRLSLDSCRQKRLRETRWHPKPHSGHDDDKGGPASTALPAPFHPRCDGRGGTWGGGQAEERKREEPSAPLVRVTGTELFNATHCPKRRPGTLAPPVPARL